MNDVVTQPTGNCPPAITFGPRVRKSPFFNATMRWGAKAFTVYNHMYMPTHYGDPIAEYWSLVNDVTLWDVSCQRQIRIAGPDAKRFVEYLTPRDLSNCPSHKCLYIVLTDDRGGVVNDAVLMHMREDEYWISPGDGDVVLWAQGVASQVDMDVIVEEGDISPIQLQGPKSPHVAYKLFGEQALNMGYYHVIETELNGIPLALSRTGWSGELGYELYLQGHEQGDDLWEMVMAAGEEYNIRPACPNLVRSVEGMLLSFVSDIRRQDNPYTIDLGRLVNLDKEADFIGRDALRRIRDIGNYRRLVGIEIEGEAIQPNESFWTVTERGKKVGHVSRACWSPRLEKNIGFANLPHNLTEIGTQINVDCPDGDRPAVVVQAPWFPAEKVLPTLEEIRAA